MFELIMVCRAVQLETLQRRLGEAHDRLAQQETLLQKQTFNKYVGGVASEPPTASADEEFDSADIDNDGQLSRREYRAWARQKAEILAKANDDRAQLLRENKRLRAALSPKVSSACFGCTSVHCLTRSRRVVTSNRVFESLTSNGRGSRQTSTH